MSEAALEFYDLEVQRGDRILFSQLSGVVSAGELLFVEGPNGAGKSTLLRCLAGLYTPDKGSMTWGGDDTHKLAEDYRKSLLYLGHLNGIKANLTGLENLRFFCTVEDTRHTDAEIEQALHQMGLMGFEDVPARMLSQGQKRRIALSRLILTSAPIWVLDEPFTALDAKAVDFLQSIISEHLDNGGIAIVTTHQETALTSASSRSIQLGHRS
jgi:heme exporter protein A